MTGETEMKTASDFHEGTHFRFIADVCEQGKSRDEAFAVLEPLVLTQTPPMIFMRNPGKGERNRVAKPISEQVIELRHSVNRVYGMMGQ
jgi:hypothetical protein